MSQYQFTWSPCTAPFGERIGLTIDATTTGLQTITLGQSLIYAPQTFYQAPTLQSIDLPNCTQFVPPDLDRRNFNNDNGSASIFIEECHALTSFTAPLLTTVYGRFDFGDNDGITYISLPSLVSLENYLWSNSTDSVFLMSFCALLTSIDLPLFTGNVRKNTKIGSTTEFNIQSNPLLTTLNLPSLVPINGCNYVIKNNALNQASVDQILQRCAAEATFVSGVLNLTGGTNSTPSAAGLINKGIINGRGVTCTTN